METRPDNHDDPLTQAPAIGGRTNHAQSPRRADSLGRCLERARTIAGFSTRKAARELRVRHSVLRSWEDGSTAPDASHLERAIRLYGTDIDRIWPDRRPIVSPDEPGVLLVGEEKVPATGNNREILVRYIAAVRRQRGAAEDEVIDLRADDLAMLGAVLDLEDGDLEAALQELLDLTSAGAKITVRALAVGVLAALAATLGAAAWIRAEAPPRPVEAAVSSPFSTDSSGERSHRRGTSTFPAAAEPAPPRALGSGTS